jgi:hypothetical protein
VVIELWTVEAFCLTPVIACLFFVAGVLSMLEMQVNKGCKFTQVYMLGQDSARKPDVLLQYTKLQTLDLPCRTLHAKFIFLHEYCRQFIETAIIRNRTICVNLLGVKKIKISLLNK